MRYRAFSLIELLVVVTVIAILVAILFPVFAQTKVAAKKTVGLSNQKQIALAIIMYAADHDDVFPRDDGCVKNSSLNPVLNDSVQRCTGVNGFGHRFNHFSWQKWIMPYVKNIQIFEEPLRAKETENWDDHGQVVFGFVLNSAITGQLDTYQRPPTFPRQFRNSWLGGAMTDVPDPAGAMMLLQAPLLKQALLSGATVDAEGIGPSMTIYPAAIKEFWRWRLMDGDVNDCVNRNKGTLPDPTKMPSQGIVIGYVDGHAKFLSAKAFLAQTPSKSEYLGVSASSPTAGWTYPTDMECNFDRTSGNFGFTVTPNLEIDYPLWSLGKFN